MGRLDSTRYWTLGVWVAAILFMGLWWRLKGDTEIVEPPVDLASPLLSDPESRRDKMRTPLVVTSAMTAIVLAQVNRNYPSNDLSVSIGTVVLALCIFLFMMWRI
jgi:hypothetical protein